MIAEWWRGRSDIRDEILGACEVTASIPATKAAGLALGQARSVDAKLTIDAIVIATAALSNAVVVTGDVHDFTRLGALFPGVVVLSA